ncbi:MFS transporter [Nocardioides massiliensis]|uniref:MFS family permease n=1 Tax=Nocardioides massiliensis TaxID=1325935 RepID=A0ABT9NT21_9ACTN|nr:MFS transporter [Nocardioides massiliensis]MDP9823427.1 MFS family permease [Nocardioides massiliensis]
MTPGPGVAPGVAERWLLSVAAIAVAFAAADTYVVVLALPDMMRGAGLSIDELQRAAPIVSGFLLGYVAMLPLIGRIADLRGRLPVLVASLLIFAFGSLITAAAYDLPSMVVGRFFQGVGGGGLVPATLALVADLYPPHRRAVPLGIVGAVQEIGSVLGPLLGAAVLAVADWQAIFWLNLAVGLVLAAALVAGRRRTADPADPAAAPLSSRARGRPDLIGLLLLAVGLALLWLVMAQPPALTREVTLGLPFVPFAGDNRWLSPLGVALLVVTVLLVMRCLTARRPLVDLRAWGRTAGRADLVGALLLALVLGGIILAFATADPEVQVFSDAGLWYLAASAVALIAFLAQQRRSTEPLVPRASLVARPAWGAMVVSFFVGSALIAALVDIPVFARVTVAPDSQLDAALVLLRLLVALPVGAVLGGYACRVIPAGAVTAAGMALTCGGFLWMSTWGPTSLEEAVATVPLVLTGLGFGLALAPVNAALLAVTPAAVHGVASALLVVARMVGMLVGISALTTIGLRRYYAVEDGLASPRELCDGASRCQAYTDALRGAGIAQLEAIFLGAAACAAIAGVLALVLLRGAPTRASDAPRLLGGVL